MAKKTRFELTVMHPGGGTFTRTVIAEHNVYDEGVYHFYDGILNMTHKTVACYPISCTIVESETEIDVPTPQSEAAKDKINHEIKSI